MAVRPPRSRSPKNGLLLAAPLIVLLLGTTPEDRDPGARARLAAMTTQQRSAVVSALTDFDLRLSTADQQAIRDLDRQIGALSAEERPQYLGTLRRYHNWLKTLPETAKDSLLEAPADQRTAQIRTLIGKYPLPSSETPVWMQFTDMTGPSPFELASLFKLWQELSEQQRKAIEQLPIQQRTPRLHALGRRDFDLAREIFPEEFDAKVWMSKAEAKLSELRISGPEFKGAPVTELPVQEGLIRKAPTKEQLRPLVLYRLAINLYGLEHPPRPVSPAQLVRFLSALPPWIRASFDTASPEEANRKLSLAYRTLFPHPSEFKPREVVPPARSKPSGPAPGSKAPQTPVPIPKKAPDAPQPAPGTPF